MSITHLVCFVPHNRISNRFILVSVILLAFAVTFPSQAESLPSFWQKQREAGNALSDKACTGDKPAVNKVWAEIESGNPVMMNNLSWLRANCRDFKQATLGEAAKYQQKAAELGYPIAMTNYANRLIRNLDDGVEQDPARGQVLLQRAIKGGDSRAALALAEYYTDGKYLRRDLAKAREYINKARSMGASAKILAQYEKALTAAIAKEPTTENKVADTSSGSEKKFAALVVSTSDGGYGFSHDYPNQEEAQSRALNECKSRGGKDCDLKMVGYGKGCMAYYFAGGNATAHGWSMGRTQGAVQDKASSECRKRNNNQACTGHAWVCNDRTEAVFNVVLEKPMPTAASSGECFQFMYAYCKRTSDSKKNIFAVPGNTFDISDCKSAIDTKSVLRVDYEFKKNAWSKYGIPKWYGSARLAAAERELKQFRSRIDRKFPSCRPDKAAFFVSRTNGGLADTIQRAEQDPNTTVFTD
jgi:TPR repeat protein